MVGYRKPLDVARVLGHDVSYDAHDYLYRPAGREAVLACLQQRAQANRDTQRLRACQGYYRGGTGMRLHGLHRCAVLCDAAGYPQSVVLFNTRMGRVYYIETRAGTQDDITRGAYVP